MYFLLFIFDFVDEIVEKDLLLVFILSKIINNGNKIPKEILIHQQEKN